MKKPLNPYIRMILWALFFMIVGALSSLLMRFGEESVGEFVQVAVVAVRNRVLWILGFFLVCSLAEWICAFVKIRKYGSLFLEEDNEEKSDYLESQMDLWSTWSTVLLSVNLIAAILTVCTIYEGKYLMAMSVQELVLMCSLFIGQCMVSSFWQISRIKQIQKIYPERKGDPSALMFNREWLESCDEAQKEVIYQSSYKTYHTICQLMPVFTVAAMISHLAWDTGIFAVVICCMIWFLLVVVYSVSSIKIQRRKLNS